MASQLNLTQEHFSRILHDLSTCGLLSVAGRDIHIENLTQFWQCACQIVSQVEEEQLMDQELIERCEQPAQGSLDRLALATVCS
ncbi:MAG: winged helix-turn-helix domain-containing protein [Dechloromonas sp.]|uniref:Winged helix-turn-helix domain-containing protein n=1 Tax=Candidatus Dechloromonas phosphorivorans TaxID=2899244 RepID=A0A935K0K0_9RHOO|nr:winged helix-turn-helix domain-containing protein [Candidatus Dechloromonas phosphorivorans]